MEPTGCTYEGETTVEAGNTVTLTFTPTKGDHGLESVKVNGQAVSGFQAGSASYTHTFEDVQGNQSISVTFKDMGYVVETDENNRPTYNVHDETGLLAWAEAANANCTLTDHIYLEEDWKQVGNWNVGYTGTFDGGGKTITGMDSQMFGAIGDDDF